MKDERNHFRGLLLLGLIWLVGALCDRVWFSLDQSVPAWDQADYLTGALNYWRALQHPQWLSGEWWTSLWMLSSKIPPGTYIATAVVHNLFGTGYDRATLVNLLFSAILLSSVYGLGSQLFNRQVGLWAAGLCLLFPGLYQARLDFLLDYPLTSVVTLCFYCLTIWGDVGGALTQRAQRGEWLWAAAFGLSMGLALMVKQTALLFLFAPVVWVVVGAFRRRCWGRLAQLSTGLLLSVAVIYPWYRTNWLLVLSGSKRATVDAAIAEGDPALNSIDAWIYYWNQLPHQVSWPLLIVPAVGFLLYKGLQVSTNQRDSLKWLAVFWVGAYLLCSLNINKDPRYVLPYLPVLSIFLAYGLTLWSRLWGQWVRWGTAVVAVLLMLVNIWPMGGGKIVPIARVQHHAYTGAQWPHQEAIAEIIKTEPYLRSTLGVLPSTPTINQHNLNYYGALANFQVYGRQVGTRLKHVPQDARSLDWFVTKTGAQGSVPVEAQAAIVQTVEQSPDFQMHKSWQLPDGSNLKLYHRQTPQIRVEAIPELPPPTQVRLQRVQVPAIAAPGLPVPVTYEWIGPGSRLQSGLVLLSWLATDSRTDVTDGLSVNLMGNLSVSSATKSVANRRWLHDHGIGMGALHGIEGSAGGFRVIEQIAMLPPADVATGIYTLKATYLNRKTGETYPIPVPPVTLKIVGAGIVRDLADNPSATSVTKSVANTAPELDLVSQLRSLSGALPKGPDALGPVFDEIGRINQYDPIQDYLTQAQLCLEYRLQQEPENVEFAYALALARVLQRRAQEAIAALERVVQLDPQNPYAHAYLAFVNLYDWRPRIAEAALKPALALNPNLPEIQVLGGAASLMQGNIVQTWNQLQGFIPSRIKTIILGTGLFLLILLVGTTIFLVSKYRFGYTIQNLK